jgi:hypothetical protein
MKEIEYENNNKKYYIKNLSDKKKFKNYITILLFVLLIIGGALILSSISKIYSIGTSEVGNVDYTVYLKDNDFYTNKFLRKGDSGVNNYIASLINTVSVDFSYNNRFTDIIDYEYEYKVDAKILVTDKYDNSKVLYTKDEVLIDTTKVDGKDNKFSINESVDIDYEKYNSYVSAFKQTYSLDVDSNLVLTMNIIQKGTFSNKQISNKASTLTITIPLTKSTIDISINTNQLANNFEIPINESIISNKVTFIIGVVICSISLLTLVAVFMLVGRKKNDIYRKEIARILKNYDRLIITSSQPNIDESIYKNKVRVMTFEELLDVNELTSEPIIYYEVEPDQKSYFIILKQDTLYKLTVSRAYLEKHKNDKKETKENKKED